MVLVALAVLALGMSSADAGARAPVKVLDFMTGADVAKAEQEGELVYYGHDSESGISTLLDAFKKDFPKIKTSYVRLQTGALYAKLTSERSANRFLVDVVQFSEVAPAIDLQKKGRRANPLGVYRGLGEELRTSAAAACRRGHTEGQDLHFVPGDPENDEPGSTFIEQRKGAWHGQ